MKQYRENQQTIAEWADRTFGETQSNVWLACRANEEIAELLACLGADNLNKIDTMFVTRKAAGEIADIVIVLYELAEHLGIDVHQAVDTKMDINRSRESRREEGMEPEWGRAG